MAIVIGLAAFGIFSQVKLADISARKSDLIDRAIPLLVRAQGLVALLATHSQQIAVLRDINSEADFDEISRIANIRQAQFNDSLAIYQQLSSNRGPQDAAMLLFGSTETLIDLQTHRQTIARSQADDLSELGAVINLMEIQIEGFRLDVLMGFQSSLDQIGIDPNAAEVTGQLSLLLNSLVTLGHL